MPNKENIVIIEKLMDHYKVYKLKELSQKMNVKYDSLSSWKNAATINPLKNICRELNIYNEIFNNLNDTNNNNCEDKKHLHIDTISYNDKELNRVIKNWGIQGYGVVIALVIYLKENNTLNLKYIDSFSKDLKTPTHLINKIIEDCNIFVLEQNVIKMNLE